MSAEFRLRRQTVKGAGLQPLLWFSVCFKDWAINVPTADIHLSVIGFRLGVGSECAHSFSQDTSASRPLRFP